MAATVGQTASGTGSAARGGKKASAMSVPRVAWPTLVVFVVAMAAWGSVTTAALLGVLPVWAAVLVGSVSAYALFTPMHDSAHKSVARTGWVSEVIGRLCALALLSPFPAFRYAHLRHHKKTNHPDDDPDIWSGGGRRWTLPLRWWTQDLHYYVIYARVWSERPVRERIEVVGTLLAVAAAIFALASAGHGWDVLVLWMLPARVAIGLLAFFFDYLPHHPHEIEAKVDRFEATSNIRGAWLTPVMFYQNYHLVHHLYPGVPFYRTGKVWRERRVKLEAKGARMRPLWGNARSAHEVVVYAENSSQNGL